jgi:hypothetical protein
VGVAYTIATFVGFVVFFFAALLSFLSAIGSGSFGSALGGILLGLLVGTLVLVGITAVAAAIAACAYINIARGSEPMEGTDIVASTIATVQRAWKSSPRLLMSYLLVFGVAFLVYVFWILLAAILPGFLVFLLSLALFVAWIWIGVSIVFFPQAVVVDGASLIDSLLDSRQLVTGYWWRTFGYLVVAWLMFVGAIIAAEIAIAILGIILSHIPILDGIVTALLFSALYAIFYAFFIIYGTLMFYDLKARKMGVAVQTAPAF